ncbi:hypothetical protein DPMN_158282 [Dreissena polymorpha]|uniref:Uncharacterized protein n=1 Tax=Dreissena polymorpha TaxID=45954 RepID=A0A9D4EM57_DREPO|nr:hypothetical protein DPMN_158282 [Dreissena polymorpha]
MPTIQRHSISKLPEVFDATISHRLRGLRSSNSYSTVCFAFTPAVTSFLHQQRSEAAVPQSV